MQIDQKKRSLWSLKDVIFIALIGIFFGIIYQLWSFVYYALAATPLKVFANDATLGVWLMAGPLASMLLHKKGASVVGELLAATVEMVLFSSWGAANLLSGLIQGVGSELGFASTGYRDYGIRSLASMVIFESIITFLWDLFQSGYIEYSLSTLMVLFAIRVVSITLFAGVLVYFIDKLVERAGILTRD
ncbi:energy-coupling factor transport system substrate-specific component [Ligilactobacillus sp. WC1T17]|uniref:Energy-coupling factor transport system substrate-specific component n=1 Tax=Ligilactobacillus ruminis TaxID=1623 RepID=A0ABY1AB95_9LACO|nr:energy-coupling factor transport system substrate-specific component [Ligilactobacillus ruminis]